jgi:hypothetical protein
MPRAAVAVPPPVVARKQLAQGGQEVYVAAGSGLDDRQASSGMRNEHMEKAVTFAAHEA